jgi:hypothetical protein
MVVFSRDPTRESASETDDNVVRMATSAGRFLALKKAVKEARFEGGVPRRWVMGNGQNAMDAGREGDPLNEIVSQTYLPI